ncbi:unnamed protein product [Didymodactylos carnosus]|uniref:Uncharacterized protein n=1 Tax=Didymodactylos carnosus TaxID=1234261 RepID=A0A813ZI87_9BILA|nr:unnamed protein product [Didymodactylos carnosus]CAF0899104.1 unnamed protein product [Didymodactylos carnosus]CAF3562396.1 unnamed protein product [Didymodactylos carnosus]CAF3681873.1 unnamed protein product [Didymodactylos carnosus]
MQRPYLPSNKSLTSSLVQTTGAFKRANNSVTTAKLLSTYHELMGNQKPIALDRFTYKLHIKSNLNINNLNESKGNHYHHNLLTQLNSLRGSRTTHRTPTVTSAATNTTVVPNTKLNSSSNDQSTADIIVQANTMHVGTLDDLIKQFRNADYKIVKRPDLNIDSTQKSSASNKQTSFDGAKHKLSRPFSEYQMNVPLINGGYHRSITAVLDTNSNKDGMHQTLMYDYQTSEHDDYDFQLPHETHQQRHLSTPVSFSQQLTERLYDNEINYKLNIDKRIKNAREKAENRTEKKVCVCHKLTIIDPFHTLNIDTDDTQLSYLKQNVPSVRYIFPPVRPFGYLTRKKQSTDDDNSTSPSLPSKKKYRRRKKSRQNTSTTTAISDETLENDSLVEKDDDYDIMTLNGTLDDTYSSFLEAESNLTLPSLNIDEQQQKL